MLVVTKTNSTEAAASARGAYTAPKKPRKLLTRAITVKTGKKNSGIVTGCPGSASFASTAVSGPTGVAPMVGASSTEHERARTPPGPGPPC